MRTRQTQFVEKLEVLPSCWTLCSAARVHKGPTRIQPKGILEKAWGPANSAMLPKTQIDVALPSRNRYTPKAFLLFQPVISCTQVMNLSNSGAMKTATLKRSGRTKFWNVLRFVHSKSTLG
jgi:hypothetical protein